MSTMREPGDDKVIAILCADIHLSLDPPRVRREESNWFRTMKKSLDNLAELSSRYNAPILCAGDIFNHWAAQPALINFALKFLPEMYAVPGQHDLPLHNIERIENSAFWTLCLADRIIPVITEEPIMAKNGIILHGFPWGRKLESLKNKIKGKYHVALSHDYFWKKNFTYKKASRNNHISKYKERVKGYHTVVFGDNHKGFKTKLNGVPVWNCGTLMRRKLHEKEYRPRIGLLCSSGKIITHWISRKNEKFKSLEDDFKGTFVGTTKEVADVLHGLKEAQVHNFDFIEAVEFLMGKYSVKNKVRKHMLEALDRG
ncbi:MAG: metallophosphoesterase [Candidatus Heimdallarchaeaceae archaeon]